MKITVLFTQGYVGIKRGRVNRKYVPTIKSFHRLCQVLNYGPVDLSGTNRSTWHVWHGYSSLDDNQRKLVRLYQDTLIGCKKYGDSYRYGYLSGVYQSCLASGIHHVLLELLDPCEHGNARSICYTCATSM